MIAAGLGPGRADTRKWGSNACCHYFQMNASLNKRSSASRVIQKPGIRCFVQTFIDAGGRCIWKLGQG